MRVAVVGLGRLGLALSLVADAAGHDVTGFDIDGGKVASIAAGTFTSAEPGIEEMLGDSRCRLRITDHLEQAVAGAAVTIVAVPTPAGDDGPLSILAVIDAVGAIGDAMGEGADDQVIVVNSTLPPGSIDGALRDRLAARIPAPALVYCPEFHAIGSIVRDLRRSPLVVIGSHEAWAGDVVEKLWRSLGSPEMAVHRMTPVAAELAKLAFNSFATFKISFANFIGELSVRWGADPVSICTALSDDPRIGTSFLRPGGPFGGPCLPRDNPALSRAAAAVDLSDDLPAAIVAVNAQRYDNIERAVLDATTGSIGVAGLAFKPGVDTVDGAPATELARRWIACDRTVHLFDPLVQQFDLAGARWARSYEELVESSDVVVLVNGDAEVHDAVLAACAAASAPPLVIDIWSWTAR